MKLLQQLCLRGDWLIQPLLSCYHVRAWQTASWVETAFSFSAACHPDSNLCARRTADATTFRQYSGSYSNGGNEQDPFNQDAGRMAEAHHTPPPQPPTTMTTTTATTRQQSWGLGGRDPNQSTTITTTSTSSPPPPVSLHPPTPTQAPTPTSLSSPLSSWPTTTTTTRTTRT